LRADQKAIKEEIRKLEPQSGLSKFFDSIQLVMCHPFMKQFQQLQYKREDFRGYEADQVVDEANKMVKYHQKMAEKGKEIKPEDYSVLSQVKLALDTIVNNQYGKKFDQAAQLSQAIMDMPIDETASKAAEEMLEQFNQVIQQAFGRPKPYEA